MRYLVGAVATVLLLVAPNLIWLATSTVRIHNASASVIDGVAYVACHTTYTVGRLRPRRSVFRFLPACGDDTLEILIGGAGSCRLYVEGELYHVDAAIDGVDTVRCSYDDLFSSLFIAKLLR